jgi:cytochrome c1
VDGLPVRAVIAGRLANSPENLQAWIRDPQRISPGTAMPDLDVGERDARDISAFLYTRAE